MNKYQYQSLQASFDAKWTPEPFSGCWLWTNVLNSRGYGNLVFNDKQYRAHRVSWELHRGAIPKGMCVCHSCDTPPCVNPDHLWLGTHLDNALDKTRKGRHRATPGERHGMSKLTAQQVIFIRSSSKSNKELAAMFGVLGANVSHIRHRRSWRHLA